MTFPIYEKHIQMFQTTNQLTYINILQQSRHRESTRYFQLPSRAIPRDILLGCGHARGVVASLAPLMEISPLRNGTGFVPFVHSVFNKATNVNQLIWLILVNYSIEIMETNINQLNHISKARYSKIDLLTMSAFFDLVFSYAKYGV